MPQRNRQSNNQRSRAVPANRPKYVYIKYKLLYIYLFSNNYQIYFNIIHFLVSPMLRRDHCPSDDELLEVTEHRPVYDAKKPAEVGNLSLFHLLIKKLY